MSQTAARQAAPPVAGPAPTSATARPAVPATQQEPDFVDTPALLNRWQLVGITVAVVFGVLSALIQFLGWQSDGRAADDTEQLVRVQEIQSSLLRADALATNAFLVGGLEDTEKRAEYEREIDDVLTLVADAAEAQPADRRALVALNVKVTDYATAVAQARDNNRQGHPIGAEYLNGASSSLREHALPILDNLVAANTDRSEDAMNGQHPFWLLLIGLVTLGVLVWLNREMAQHFRRRINKGIAVAAVITFVVTVVSVALAWAADSSNDNLREGDLAAAIDQADARTAANDAKALESLRLIKRGAGADFETEWVTSAAVVEESRRRDSGDAWNAYVAVHEQIVELDESGRWEEARELATTEDDGGSTAPLDSFNAESESIVTSTAARVTDDLRGGRALALGLSAVTLLLGLVAAFAVARGVGERRREFA